MSVRCRAGILAVALALLLIVSGCMTVPQHPDLAGSGQAPGYVEFFHSAWLLGPDSNTVGGHSIYAGTRKLGHLFAPQYPWGCSHFSLATSLWIKRVALPPGENELTIVIGNQRTPCTVSVEEGRMTLVRLESEIISTRKTWKGTVTTFKPLKVFTAATTLPKPRKLSRVSVDPESYDALIKLLEEKDWGLRAYAVRRLKVLQDVRALPHLEKACNMEDNPSLKGEMQSTIEKLKKT